MEFDYAITLEDFREASQWKSPGPKRPRGALDNFYSMFALFCVCIMAALPGWLGDHDKQQTSDLNLLPPTQNLWVVIAPSLVVATCFLGNSIVIRSQLGGHRRARFSIIVAVSVLYLLALLWLVLALTPVLALRWSPTSTQALSAALAPWALYLAVTSLLAARKGTRSLDRIWQSRPWLQRLQHICVTDGGITTDDGVVHSNYKWSHYKRYAETENLIILTSNQGGTSYVAKRCLPDQSAIDEFKMLIQNNVADGKFLKADSAFPVVLPVLEPAKE